MLPALELNGYRLFSTVTDSLNPLSFAAEAPVFAGEVPSTGQGTQCSLGDYVGIDFHGERFFAAWANNSGDAPAGDPPPNPGGTFKADVYGLRVDVPYDRRIETEKALEPLRSRLYDP